MAITISGVLSDQVTDLPQVTNLSNKLVQILDDVDFDPDTEPDVDCALVCRSLLLPIGRIGESDGSGVVNPVIVYAYADINESLRPSVVVRNAQISSSDFIIYGAFVAAGLAFRTENCDITNSTIILQESYLGQRVEVSIGANSVQGLTIRNAPITYWDFPSSVVEKVNNIFSTWGIASRGAEITLTGVTTDNLALLNDGTLNLVDCRVTGWMHWLENNTSLSKYIFTKTFNHKLEGEYSVVFISCYDNTGSPIYTTVTDEMGEALGEQVSWAEVTKVSAGVNDSWDYQVSNNAATFNDLEVSPDRFSEYRLPLTFIFYSYITTRKRVDINNLSLNDDFSTTPYTHREIIERDPFVRLDELELSSLTQINNLQELYDYSKLWNVNTENANYPSLDRQLVEIEDNTLDLGDLNLVVDATATTLYTLNKETGVLTIKSSMLSPSESFSHLRTTGFITFVNGAIADVSYEDDTVKGIRFVINPADTLDSQVNGVTVQSRYKLRLRRSLNGSVQTVFVPANGRVVIPLNKNEIYTVNADGFLWRRVNGITVDTNLQDEVSIIFSRYTNLSGQPITNITPNLDQADLVTYDYDLSRLIVAYDANNPSINFNSIVYALERIQSGQNPDIPGSSDQGLAMTDVIDIRNGRLFFNASTSIRLKAADGNNPINRPYLGVELEVEGLPTPIGILDLTNGRAFDYIQPVTSVVGPVAVDLTPVLDLVREVKAKTDALPLESPSKSDVDGIANSLSSFTIALDGKINGLRDQVATRMAESSYIAPPSGFEISEALMEGEVYSGWSLRLILRLLSSVLGGRTTGGMQSTAFRDLLDTKDAVVSNTDNEGNRASVFYDLED